MIDLLQRFILPAAYDRLPTEMGSLAASAQLLAIALQESDGTKRRQLRGPARGFWQFETSGVRGVQRHPSSRVPLRYALKTLGYPVDLSPTALQAVLEHNDVVAAVCARLLLWTLPDRLPSVDRADVGWGQYLAAWRPGKPRPTDWPANYARAWGIVSAPAGEV